MKERDALASFDCWFAAYLNLEKAGIEQLLCDKTATRFLIAWSIFEQKYFDGFAKVEKFPTLVDKLLALPGFKLIQLNEIASQFHSRYQDRQLYSNLIHKGTSDQRIESILAKNVELLSDDEVVLFLLFVVYRFRNNIFHGNKKVDSWLKFKPQIELCLDVMLQLMECYS